MSFFGKWLREPLVHFMLIGAALFLFYSLQNDDVEDNPNTIVITEAEIDRLINIWEKQWQRLPTTNELEGLVESQIREEVLYREALALGLDQDDVVVRRRLAQKVEFIFSGLASLLEPTDGELHEFLAANEEKFEIPPRVDFRQVYLNTDNHGGSVTEQAASLLLELRSAGPEADISLAGDRFMFGQQFQDQTPSEVGRIFGQAFADELFKLEVGDWVGPVWSGYGIHLVNISQKLEARLPVMDDIRDKVRFEWLAQKRREGDEMFYQSLRQRYRITIENAASESNPVPKNISSTGQ